MLKISVFHIKFKWKNLSEEKSEQQNDKDKNKAKLKQENHLRDKSIWVPYMKGLYK